ncbi:anti-sigma factor [Kallotenue papyrolyticum]|uniref:anti-sigma factor n=1 Tax=Kallotenue papyrolyticum TaxID=1325125 RepID=UPI000492AB2B|nr:anti-sigma factor [Kallotenue papyrolyticum]
MTESSEQCLTIQAQLAAYALGERPLDAELRAHLAMCEDCRQALAGYAQVARVLPYAAPAAVPSPALRARLLAAISSADAATTPALPRQSTTRSRRPLPAWGLALAVVLALLFWNVALHRHLDQQSRQLAASRANWQAMVWLLNDAAVHPIRLQGASTATFWAAPDQTVGCLVAQGLPQPPAGHVYQIWLIQDQAVESAGTFLPQGMDSWTIIRTNRSPLDYDLIRVTLEPAGGSTTPSGPVVLEGRLDTTV